MLVCRSIMPFEGSVLLVASASTVHLKDTLVDGVSMVEVEALENSQQGVHDGRVRASVAQVVNKNANAVACFSGSQLLKGTWQLDDICKVAAICQCTVPAGGWRLG